MTGVDEAAALRAAAERLEEVAARIRVDTRSGEYVSRA